MRKISNVLICFLFVLQLVACTVGKSTEQEAIVEKVYSYVPYPEAYRLETVSNVYNLESLPSRFITEVEDYFDIDVESAPIAFSDADYFGGEWQLIPKKEVVQLWEKMYGKGTFESYNFNFVTDIGDYGSSGILMYDENSDSYVYAQNFSSDGLDIGCQSYRKMISYETDGDMLFIYDIYGSFYVEPKYDDDLQITEWAAIISGECVLVHFMDYDHYVIDKTVYSNNDTADDTADSVLDKLYNGEYDEQLPTYKHTFVKAEDGSYYWVQSEALDKVNATKTEDLWK